MPHPRPGEQYLRQLEAQRAREREQAKKAPKLEPRSGIPLGMKIELVRHRGAWHGVLTASGVTIRSEDQSPSLVVKLLLDKWHRGETE